jgi:hypothetical protein
MHAVTGGYARGTSKLHGGTMYIGSGLLVLILIILLLILIF